MSHTNRYLNYYIVLTDPDLVKKYQEQFPYGYQFAPYNPHDNSTGQPGGAAIAFQAPWTGSYPGFTAPYTWSPSWTSQNNYDQTVASFTRKTGGFWGIGGDEVTYYWVGQFVLADPPIPTINTVPVVAPTNYPKRRWAEGFELGAIGPAGAGNTAGILISRDASRHVGGYGLALRGTTGVVAEMKNDLFNAGYTTQFSWERFYLRVRQLDATQSVEIWESYTTESANYGARIDIAANAGTAQLVLYSKRAGVYTLRASGGSIPVWTGVGPTDGFHKIDILLTHAYDHTGADNPFQNGSIRVFVDGVLVVSFSDAPNTGGLGANGTTVAWHHRGSTIGNAVGTANELYVDIDDWISAEVPGRGNSGLAGEALTSKDWLGGTKIVCVRPKQYSANHSVNWAGDFRILLPNRLGTGQAGLANDVAVTSSTPSAILEADTDSDLTVDGDPAGAPLGVASLSVSLCSTSVNSTDGQLGYGLNGAAPILAVVDQTAAMKANSVFYTVNGTANTLPDVTPIRFRFVKAATADLVSIYELLGQAELVGAWGAADYRTTENGTDGTPTFPAWVGQHNAPYPRARYGSGLYAAQGPFLVFSGTYVGNGTAQDLTFKAPLHLLYIRPTTGDAGGAKWWSSMGGGAHRAADRNPFPAGIVNIDQDETFVPGLGDDTQQERYRVRIVGADTQFNALGVTYQYFALSDPAARFLLSLSIAAKTTTASLIDALVAADWLPEAAFVWPETYTGNAGGQPLLKGGNLAASDLGSFTGVAKVTGLSLAAGSLTSLAALHALPTTVGTIPMLLLRRADGNNDPGQNAVVQIVGWTGDGTASRTIALQATGKRPIFAIATGDASAGGFQRDASHTTVNSTGPTGTNSTTGITGAGIDSISVGATLNTLNVNYVMIVFFGDATAGNGGFGINGTFAPVQADYAQTGLLPGMPLPPDPSVFHPVVPPTPLSGQPDLDQTTVLLDAATELGGLVGGQKCEYYTRALINIALTRVGVSKRVADLIADNTEESVLAQSHILEDVNTTLRAVDWQCFTRYADLTLVAGTEAAPVNQDWTYAYRAPASMMKARRLVNQSMVGRNYDRNPPKFRVGSDASGLLIYTNERNDLGTALVLEYTVRSLCPAFYGDALFRDALAWKFAESLAPGLSRDPKRQDYCRQRFMIAVGQAAKVAAQEQQQAKPGDADWISDRDYNDGFNPRDPWNR